jgi:hypothetical protein
MEAYVAAIRPKQHNTYSQDFHPQGYDILLTEELNMLTNQEIKCFPMTPLSFEDEPSEILCAFLHEITGGDICGLKGLCDKFVH